LFLLLFNFKGQINILEEVLGPRTGGIAMIRETEDATIHEIATGVGALKIVAGILLVAPALPQDLRAVPHHILPVEINLPLLSIDCQWRWVIYIISFLNYLDH
jgi:hypothetical protein